MRSYFEYSDAICSENWEAILNTTVLYHEVWLPKLLA